MARASNSVEPSNHRNKQNNYIIIYQYHSISPIQGDATKNTPLEHGFHATLLHTSGSTTLSLLPVPWMGHTHGRKRVRYTPSSAMDDIIDEDGAWLQAFLKIVRFFFADCGWPWETPW